MPASPPAMTAGSAAPAADAGPDPTERLDALLVDLRQRRREGLSSREAARRLAQHGPNELRAGTARGWPRAARRAVHPSARAPAVGRPRRWPSAGQLAALGVAILVVVVLNAAFAFVQERHAERAVEALQAYLPPQARVVRDGREQDIDARELVPGDLMVVDEGERDLAPTPALRRGRARGRPVGAHRRVGAGRSAPPSSPTVGGPPLEARRPRLQRHDVHRRRGARASSSRPACRRSSAASPRCRSAAATEPQPAAARGAPRRAG